MALGTAIVASLPLAYGVIGDDAAKHMVHYFGNQGSSYRIDLEGMVRDVGSAKDPYEDEMAQAKESVELLPVGRHDIRSRHTQNGYNLPEESRNWYYAIGGYKAWGGGTAAVSDVGGQRQFELAFQYTFYDRCNWTMASQSSSPASPSPISSWGSSTARASVKSLIALAPSRGASAGKRAPPFRQGRSMRPEVARNGASRLSAARRMYRARLQRSK
jgi:hypothetical protein